MRGTALPLATGLLAATLVTAGIVLWTFSDRLSERSRSYDDPPTVERLAAVGLRLFGLYLVAVGLAGFVATFGDAFWPRNFFRPLGSIASGFILFVAARPMVTSLPPAKQDGPSWRPIAVMGLQVLGIFFLAKACIEVIGSIPAILSSFDRGSGWSSIARGLLPAMVEGVCGVVLVTRATALVGSPSRASAPLLDEVPGGEKPR